MTKVPTFKGLGMALYWTLGAYFILVMGLSACNRDETPSVLQGECGGALGLLEWTAVKNGTALVTGRQTVTGQTRGQTVSLSFELRPRSGIELRDDRLRDLVFGPEVFSFIGSSDGPLPGPGETLASTFRGSLSLGGKLIPLEVPVELDWLSEGVLNARGSFEVSLEALGLTDRVSALLSLVDATLEDKVKAHFDIEVKEPCP